MVTQIFEGNFRVKMSCTRNGQLTSDVVGYCDSDYAGDLDKRRLLSGFVFTLKRKCD